MFLSDRNKAVILSWAGGGQSSPPVQLWSDEEEEEEEGILLFVAIKYKKKKMKEASGDASDDDEEEGVEEEDVNNNSDRLTDSGIGEEREKGDEAEKEVADEDKGEVNLNSSEAGHREESSGEKNEAFDKGKEGTNETIAKNRGEGNETIKSTRNENIESSKGDECSDGRSLESEEGEDDRGNIFLLQDEKSEKVGKESLAMKNLADVVNNLKEAKSMEDEGTVTVALKEETLIEDKEGKDGGSWVEKGQDGVEESEITREDECDVKVVSRPKREGEACGSKRVTWKAEGGLEERLGGDQVQVRKSRRFKSMESRGRGRGIVGEAVRGDESVGEISERPSGVEIGRAWERSLRLASGVRKSPEQRQLRSSGGGGRGNGLSQKGGKRQDRAGERGESGEAKEKIEGDWEEDGGGAGWRSLRRLRSKPHRPSSGR